MPALSWVRLTRRIPGVVRQRELANLEALIDVEAGRQPTRNLFVLSCAIPAGIATFGGLSVFLAWISGTRGLPLALGAALTVILAAGAWLTFFKLYRSVPPSKRRLRDLVFKLSKRYASFGNMILGEKPLSDQFAALLDEASGIYLRYDSGAANATADAPAKAVSAIEEALSKLLEAALVNDQIAQEQALSWAQPTLEEMRLLDRSLVEHATNFQSDGVIDPLAGLRAARAELDIRTTAIQELDQELRQS